jgi:hypothetical protein
MLHWPLNTDAIFDTGYATPTKVQKWNLFNLFIFVGCHVSFVSGVMT